MRRLLVAVCVVAFLAAMPLSHAVMAEPADKVDICHINSANDSVLDADGNIWVFGHVITVSGNAVEAHILRHGDSTEFVTFDTDFRDWVEMTYNIRLPNANCYFGGLTPE